MHCKHSHYCAAISASTTSKDRGSRLLVVALTAYSSEEWALISCFNGLESAASLHSSLVAEVDVGSRPHLSSRLLPFASVSHVPNRPRRDARLSWPYWLTDSGHLNYKVVTHSVISLALDRESSLAEISALSTMLCHQWKNAHLNKCQMKAYFRYLMTVCAR